MVRAEPAANNANPVFPDEDTETGMTYRLAGRWTRTHLPARELETPVVANDAPGDVLTYTLAELTRITFVNYRIDPATGQITVGPRTALDRETIGGATHTVQVTATDPWGDTQLTLATATQEVTITINDVNEAR